VTLTRLEIRTLPGRRPDKKPRIPRSQQGGSGCGDGPRDRPRHPDQKESRARVGGEGG
jgi:hypothetical protein